MKKERLMYIDIIKVLAMFFVVLLHAAASVFYSVSIDSSNFFIYNFYDSIARSCVPLFVMVSGAYFLNNNNKLDTKKLYKKYIFKIVIVLVISSTIIELIKYILNPEALSAWEFLKNIIVGDSILWFFYMLLGLYIITPILRQITKSKEITLYLIIILFILSVFIPTLNHILEFEFLETVIAQMFFGMFDTGNGYFVLIYYLLGFYLSEYKIKKGYTNSLYILGIIGVILTFILTQYYSITTKVANPYFYNYLSLTVFFTPVAIFLFLKSKLSNKISDNKLLLIISTSTLLIYPVHRMLMIIFSVFDLSKLLIKYPLLGVPIYSVIIFSLSLIISLIIKKISSTLKAKPILKYIVYFIILLLIIFI